MSLARRHILSLVAATSVGGAALLWGAMNAEAASATASASVTVVSAGSVGPVAPEPADDNSPEDTASESTSGSIIPTLPLPSATSSLGFSPVAPVAAEESQVEPGSGSSSSSPAGDGGSDGPVFSNPNISTEGLGPASAVAVAGEAFQAFSFVLPEATVYQTSNQLVTLTNFEHTAGATPFLGGDGSGFFNIGAQINQSPLTPASTDQGTSTNETESDEVFSGETVAPTDVIASVSSNIVLIGSDRSPIIAAAFSSRAPFVNIMVSYN